MTRALDQGHAPVNSLEMYWERRASGGPPVVVLGGAFNTAGMIAPLLDELATIVRWSLWSYKVTGTPEKLTAPSSGRYSPMTSRRTLVREGSTSSGAPSAAGWRWRQLAIPPGQTHYDVFVSDALPPIVDAFLR